MRTALYWILGSILVLSLALIIIFASDLLQPSADEAPPPESEAATAAEPLRAQEPGLPAFPYPNLLQGLPQSCQQAIVVLGQGSYGNLWLVELTAQGPKTAAGPLYCRLGKEGLTAEKTDGDDKTPLGITTVGRLLAAARPEKTTYTFQELTPRDVWVTDMYSVHYNRPQTLGGLEQDFESYITLTHGKHNLYLDIGYNTERVPGRGAAVLLCSTNNLAVPTNGEIALSYEDTLRIVQWLDAAKEPNTAIFLADEAGWQLEQGMAPGFQFTPEAIATARQYPVYALADNWLGEALPGYLGYQTLLSSQLTEALQQVQRDLRVKRLQLVILDAYRPTRAGEYLQQLHPQLQLSEACQMHSHGLAVDLTLGAASDEQALDLGGPYDPLAESAPYAAAGLTEEQRENRRILREAMQEAGFRASEDAWWHFELPHEYGIRAAYDFIIPQ